MRPMRRKDKMMPQADAVALLEKVQHGVLSTVGEQGPYGVPISYVLDGGSIYFHSAITGHKLDNINYDPRACFTVMESGEPFDIDRGFTLAYRSVIVFGELTVVKDDGERASALEKLIRKYFDVPATRIADYLAIDMHRTAVFKLNINELSGKQSYLDRL